MLIVRSSGLLWATWSSWLVLIGAGWRANPWGCSSGLIVGLARARARRGPAWPGLARIGPAWPGVARLGLLRFGCVRPAQPGSARVGLARDRVGLARFGSVRFGRARPARHPERPGAA